MSTPDARLAASLQGVVDLGALAAAREAKAKAEEAAAKRAAAGPGAPVTVIEVTDATFATEVVERSMGVPVIVDLWATWCQPCKTLSPILESLAESYGGRLVLAKIDVDASPGIAQAFQVQSIPSVYAVLKGSPIPLFQGAQPEPQVRAILDQVLVAAQDQGLTGPHSSPSDAVDAATAPAEPSPLDSAYEAMERGEWELAEASFESILTDAVPGTETHAEASTGLTQARFLKRATVADPESGPMGAADSLLLSGDVEEALGTMLKAITSSAGEERDALRDRLVELFDVVGPADPRVAAARTRLASALF